MSENKIMTLENMRDMPIEDIIILYKDGYRLDESLLKTLQYDCSGPMLGAALLGIGLGGLITALIIKIIISK